MEKQPSAPLTLARISLISSDQYLTYSSGYQFSHSSFENHQDGNSTNTQSSGDHVLPGIGSSE